MDPDIENDELPEFVPDTEGVGSVELEIETNVDTLLLTLLEAEDDACGERVLLADELVLTLLEGLSDTVESFVGSPVGIAEGLPDPVIDKDEDADAESTEDAVAVLVSVAEAEAERV